MILNTISYKANISYLLGMFALLLIWACGEGFDFEKKQTIGNKGWAYSDVLDFDLNIADTTTIYNIYLEIEHATDYSKQNLYTLIHTKFPSGERLKEQVSLELADKRGKWNGNCSSSSCTLRIPIQEGAFFSQAGQYTFSVEQYMRQNPLAGIKSIALMLEDTQQKR